MQLLVEAREHINRYEFSQAIEKCKSVLSNKDESLEAYEILLEVLRASDHLEYRKYLKEFLLILNEQKDFEKYYLYYNKIKSLDEKISISMRMDYLRSIWELGRLKEFSVECENLHIFCIDQKYFNHLENVVGFIESYAKRKMYLMRGKIIFYCETNDEVNLDILLRTFFTEEVYSRKKWKDIDLNEIEAVKDILKLYRDQSVVTGREYIRCEIVTQLAKKSDIKIDIKIILEFLLMASKPEDYYLLYERETHLIVEDALSIYIKSKHQQSLSQIPYLFQKTRALFSSGVTMAVVNHQNETVIDSVEAPELYELNYDSYKSVEVDFQPIRVLSSIEKELITQLKYEEYDQVTLNELVISFIEMELYKTALELCEKLEESKNKYYLKAQVNLNLGNDTEVILIINECFSEYELENIEKPPFLYLKAMAFNRLSRPEEAHALFKTLAIIDPGFMDIRGKLKR